MNVSTVSTAFPDNGYPKVILFDLLAALLDSWSSWNRAVGSEQAGRTWCAEHPQLTYGYDTYAPYEAMVRQAVQNVGLPASAPAALEANWLQPASWGGAAQAPAQLQSHCKLAVVTNCLERPGQQAAALLSITWDVVITAEQAGVHRPDPKPYRMTLEQLGVDAADAVLVAGPSYGMFGTATAGLRTYQHNWIGLTPVEGAQLPEITSPILDDLLPWVCRSAA